MFETNSQYGERQLIGPDTEILGGVFLARGAIVVDFEENPAPYEALYDVVDKTLPPGSEDSLLRTAEAVNWCVVKAVPYSPATTASVLKRQAEARGLQRIGLRDEIALSSFIEAGGGVCHHLTLVAGTMLRLLQDRREQQRSVSIDQAPTSPQAHAWVRYTEEEERVIVDPSEDHVIRLGNHPDSWDRKYLRSEEKLVGKGMKQLLSKFAIVKSPARTPA